MSIETLIIIIVAASALVVVLWIVFQLGIFSFFAAKEAAEGEVNRASKPGTNLIGMTGTARTDLDPEGMVFVFGELWNARVDSDFVIKGSEVRVTKVDGMTLHVVPLSDAQSSQ